MCNIKFVYLFHENVSPALFAKIIRPSVAGQWIASVPTIRCARSSRATICCARSPVRILISPGAIRTLIAQDLEMGRVVAIDESFRDWSSVTEIFLHQCQRATSRLPRWSAWAGIR